MNKIDEAFQKVRRADFLPEDMRKQAYDDIPLPIGYGQTNSQPYTVHKMLEWLDAGEGYKVLDIGSGSGWTTALLAQIVGATGKVYAVERIPDLVEFGRKNCDRVGIKNVQFFEADKELGLPKYVPYDRILVSASASKLPEELLSQLRITGKLVIPVQDDILEITKTSKDKYDIKIHPGFAFVPLIKD